MSEFKKIEIPRKIIDSWQEAVNILSSLCSDPAGLIMKVEEPYIKVFTASSNKENPYKSGDKEHFENSGLYCEDVIKNQHRLHVPNALKDPKWKTNPDIELNMISYLGYPLNFPNGKNFGTICLLDNKENHYSDTMKSLLEKFKRIVEADLELLYFNFVNSTAYESTKDFFNAIAFDKNNMVTICSNCKEISNIHGKWHPIEYYINRFSNLKTSHGICELCYKKLYKTDN